MIIVYNSSSTKVLTINLDPMEQARDRARDRLQLTNHQVEGLHQEADGGAENEGREGDRGRGRGRPRHRGQKFQEGYIENEVPIALEADLDER